MYSAAQSLRSSCDSTTARKLHRRDVGVIDKLESCTVYKCVLLQTDNAGTTSVLDLRDGHLYYIGLTQNRVSNNGLMFKSKTGALAESTGAYLKKIGLNASSSFQIKYERVIAAFDAWGKVSRASGAGTQAATYEFVRYRGVVQVVDKPSLARNRPPNVCEPHFFSTRDRAPAGGSLVYDSLNANTFTGAVRANNMHSPRSHLKAKIAKSKAAAAYAARPSRS